MTFRKKILLLSAAFTFMIVDASIAQEMMIPTLKNITQRNKINPAFMTGDRIFAGFPLTSSIRFSYSNNGFTYNDLIKRDADDSLYFDIENMISKLDSRNSMQTNMENDIIWFGVTIGKNQLTLNVAEKVNAEFQFSRSMMEFLYYGNGAFIGTAGNINPGIEATHYREYGINWSRSLNQVINAGISVKYLYGMEHIHTEGKGVTLYTDPEDYTLYGYSDITVYTSGIANGALTENTFNDYIAGKSNHGFAFDLGLDIKVSKRSNISLSVLDLGSIRWNEDNMIYASETTHGPVVYEGLDLSEFINQGNSSEEYLESLIDSIYDAFNVTESEGSFTYTLPMQIYGIYNLAVGKNGAVSATTHLIQKPQNTQFNYNISYSGIVKEWLNYSIGYSSINNTHGNIGAGVAFNFKVGQLYLVSDNIIGLLNYRNSHHSSLRAGFTFTFNGSNKKKAGDTTPDPADNLQIPQTTPDNDATGESP
jgi:hypothetical protein